MNGGTDEMGRLLTQLAALERGHHRDLVTEVRFTPEGVTVVLSDGTQARLPHTAGAQEIHAVVAGFAGPVSPASASEQFPDEPLTGHQKWTELLEDIGAWHSALDDLVPGLRLESIRRQGPVARLTVGDGHHRLATELRLDDGHLVVGVDDDLATRFAHHYPSGER